MKIKAKVNDFNFDTKGNIFLTMDRKQFFAMLDGVPQRTIAEYLCTRMKPKTDDGDTGKE